MLVRRFAWGLMALLAFAVAGYAIAISLVDDLRTPLVRQLFALRPGSAWGHFLGGAVAIAVGALQTHTTLRNRWPALHRWTGRVYVVAVAAGGLAALAMAPQASTGAVAAFGFGALAVCWLGTTALAVIAIRQRRIADHRDWMLRSYALTLAAVTLRLYLPASQIAGISFLIAYPAIAWLCWVPNLLAAEWMLRTRHARTMLPRTA
ncbi:DUF2306 domain-containing protein [Pseudoxanthomonas sp. PXM01]|uniref:DUF2306 domain-containing protein n=1 Tax=Pseudoxanthomonas sp. PXM01 TaxID=2769295 RepID=UPI00177FF255|nr:DUF2306 domain-containing protein [Pseudoxanthomonas sp. PXM01]MBD9469382.1 DUF2306 domain-containing protein [Pseudoxanthomonas sp. PXM01]